MDISKQEEIKKTSIEVFCCYSRKDQELFLDLKTHLTPLVREGLIALWADIDIDAGTEWKTEIHRHLDTAQIILLLISSDFIASEYCYSIEMTHAMERHERGEVCVIPIVLRPVYWQNAPFGKLQSLPSNAEPVVSPRWHNLDEAFLNVALGIRAVYRIIEPTNRSRKLPNRWHKIRLNPYVQRSSKVIAGLSPAKVSNLSHKEKEQILEYWVNKGIAYHEDQSYINALVAYETAISLSPTEEAAWVGKGDVLFDLGRYEEALESYEQIIQECSYSTGITYSSFSTLYRKGTTLFSLQRYEEALDAYKQAVDDLKHVDPPWNEPTDLLLSALDRVISINPQKAAAYKAKGDIFFCLRQYEKALNHYEQAIEIAVDDIDIYYSKAKALCNLDRDKAALATLDQAILADPNDFIAYWGKSRILQSLGHYDEAIKAIDQAIYRRPNNSRLYKSKGEIFVDSLRDEEALIAFEMAGMALSPSSYMLRYIYRQKSFILERLGREKEAEQAKKEFLKIPPRTEINVPLKLDW